MDLRQNRLPWSEQIWAKINADLAQALTQARRVRGPFEVFHVSPSQQTVMADRAGPTESFPEVFPETDSLPVIELAVNFTLAPSQVDNEGENFYALDQIIGAAYELGRVEDDLLFHGKRQDTGRNSARIYVSSSAAIGGTDGRKWDGIAYSHGVDPVLEKKLTDLKLDGLDNLNTVALESKTAIADTSTNFNAWKKSPSDKALIAKVRDSIEQVARIVATGAKVASSDARVPCVMNTIRQEFPALFEAVDIGNDGRTSIARATAEAKRLISKTQHREATIISAANRVFASFPDPSESEREFREKMVLVLLLVAMVNLDARSATIRASEIGQPSPGGRFETWRSVLRRAVVEAQRKRLSEIQKAERDSIDLLSAMALEGVRPAHPPAVHWSTRDHTGIGTGKTGLEVYNAVLEARKRLRDLSRYEPFALLISNELEGALQSTIQGSNSLNTPIERLRPLVTAGIYTSPSLPSRDMYVIAASRSWFDISQALEPSIQFMSINPETGAYNLRLIERFAFRLKDGTARCKITMAEEVDENEG